MTKPRFAGSIVVEIIGVAFDDWKNLENVDSVLEPEKCGPHVIDLSARQRAAQRAVCDRRPFSTPPLCW